MTEGTGEAETYTTEEMVDILGKVIVLQRDKILQKNEEIAELKKQDTRVKHMIKKAAKWVLRRE
ncbi:unknown [Clostridium sp. CAG:277]|nr:unknown [Clostridium sp. CAG:277]